MRRWFVEQDLIEGVIYLPENLFYNTTAPGRRSDAVYLAEVQRCDIYLALLGNEYGWEDVDGLSPTHREFNAATTLGKHRIVFVKRASDADKHPKMQTLIASAGAQLIRRRFIATAELIPALYASLVDYLAVKELLRFGPFDAAACPDATTKDLSAEKIRRFVGVARRARGFPLAEDTGQQQVLEHLNLLNKGRPTHAAILLFGKLRHPHGSVPGNPLLAEPHYLTKYIERMGTGTGDMIKLCREAGLDEPEFSLTDGFVTTIRRKPSRAFEVVGGQMGEVTGEVTGQVGTKSGQHSQSRSQSRGQSHWKFGFSVVWQNLL